jgi:hypothetical protein
VVTQRRDLPPDRNDAAGLALRACEHLLKFHETDNVVRGTEEYRLAVALARAAQAARGPKAGAA